MNPFGVFVEGQLQAAQRDGRRADDAMFELEARVRVLEKSTHALWSLLKAKTDWTDEELIEQANALEATQTPGLCPACGRQLLVQHAATCSWCGHRLVDSTSITPPEEPTITA